MNRLKFLEWAGVATAILYSMLIALKIGAEFIGFSLLLISAFLIGLWAYFGRHRRILFLQLFYAAAGLIGMLRWFQDPQHTCALACHIHCTTPNTMPTKSAPHKVKNECGVVTGPQIMALTSSGKRNNPGSRRASKNASKSETDSFVDDRRSDFCNSNSVNLLSSNPKQRQSVSD